VQTTTEAVKHWGVDNLNTTQPTRHARVAAVRLLLMRRSPCSGRRERMQQRTTTLPLSHNALSLQLKPMNAA